MKNRTVDLVLIVGLALVAGAIVWTLFSLGGERRVPAPETNGTIDTPADGADIVPIDPDGSAGDGSNDASGGDSDAAGGGATSSGDADASGVDGAGDSAASDAASSGGNAAADGATDGPVATVGDGGPTPDRPNPEIPAADAPPVPASASTGIGRVGFSFVTGGAGACGIVLEAWTHVAVSRELLDAYGCGAEVTLTLDDPKDGRTTVQAIVADTMNPSFSRTVNVYVGEDEPALQYGLTSGSIIPR